MVKTEGAGREKGSIFLAMASAFNLIKSQSTVNEGLRTNLLGNFLFKV